MVQYLMSASDRQLVSFRGVGLMGEERFFDKKIPHPLRMTTEGREALKMTPLGTAQQRPCWKQIMQEERLG
jgi:hypothetical protein